MGRRPLCKNPNPFKFTPLFSFLIFLIIAFSENYLRNYMRELNETLDFDRGRFELVNFCHLFVEFMWLVFIYLLLFELVKFYLSLLFVEFMCLVFIYLLLFELVKFYLSLLFVEFMCLVFTVFIRL